MSQHHSIYKSDYVAYNWMENNFSSNSESFCSCDNIDDCVQYISQECCALGYPPIYVDSTSCQYAVNCDIVNLLNVTFELLGSSRDYIQSKDDLECRNRRLAADFSALSRKNTQLKDTAEKLERKYQTVLERERQLKEKNEQLMQSVKTEKNEAKKLSSQMQQEKVAYQHEMRKSENSMNQMKSRLKQILTVKNSDKKVASISTSNLLQRSSKERGKWKTDTANKSCVEDMYHSIISSYEKRCQDMLKDISEYQVCLDFIQAEVLQLISEYKEDEAYKESAKFNDVPLSVIWNGPNKVNELKERFDLLVSEIRESVSKHVKEKLEKYELEAQGLKSRLSDYEKFVQECTKSAQPNFKGDNVLEAENYSKIPESSKQDLESSQTKLEAVKEKLRKERLELTTTITLIEKEKANLEAQRLNLIKMAMQQDVPKSEWHEDLKPVPSFSVITTKNGVTAIPTAIQLKQCLSAPDQQLEGLKPLWNMGSSETEKSKSELNLNISQNQESVSFAKEDIRKNNDLVNSELPKWASSCTNIAKSFEGQSVLSDTLSSEDLEVSTISEEQNLSLLEAAIKDIENRRNNPSS